MIPDLHSVRCFVAVAEELHFGRAATRLFMTQPPLSRQIQLLESALGVSLLIRTSRSVRLSAAGRLFLDDARRLLGFAEQAAVTARRAAAGEQGRVILGFTAVSGYEKVPSLIAAAARHLPDIEIVLKEMVTARQIDALATGSLDLALMRPQALGPAFGHRALTREPLVAVLPAAHALAARSELVLQDFDDQAVIMYARGEGEYFYDLIAGLLASVGARPRYVQHIGQTHTILALVRAGVGVALVPASAQCFRFEGLVFRALREAPAACAEIHMAWRRDRDNPALDTLRRFAIQHVCRPNAGAAQPQA